MKSIRLAGGFFLMALISQAAFAQEGTVAWEKEAAQKEIDGMRRYAWALSGAIADSLKESSAEKFPAVHAFLRDFDAARKEVDSEKSPSEWKTIDVAALAIRNPNYWAAVYEVEPAAPLMMWFHASLHAVNGEYLAEVKVDRQEKGEGPDDLIYARYFTISWKGPGQMPPGPSGHYPLPKHGGTYRFYLSRSAYDGFSLNGTKDGGYNVVYGNGAQPADPPQRTKADETKPGPRETFVKYFQAMDARESKVANALKGRECTDSLHMNIHNLDIVDRLQPFYELSTPNQALVVAHPFTISSKVLDREEVLYAELAKQNGAWRIQKLARTSPENASSLMKGFQIHSDVKLNLSTEALVGRWWYPCDSTINLKADGTGSDLEVGPAGPNPDEKPVPFTWTINGSTLIRRFANREEQLVVTSIDHIGVSFGTDNVGPRDGWRRRTPVTVIADPIVENRFHSAIKKPTGEIMWMKDGRVQQFEAIRKFASIDDLVKHTTTLSAHGQQPVVPAPVMNVTVKGGSFRGLRFSADGSRIWTDRLESWSVASGKKLDSTPVAKQKEPYFFDISPTGKRMLIVHQQSGTLIWDQDRPPRERALPKKGPVRFVRFLDKGERFAALLSDPPSVLLGNVDSNKDDKVLPLPFEVHRGDFSLSGRLLACRKARDVVAVWDLELKQQRCLLRHDDSVFSVAISPDGRLVATGASDNVVRLFSTVNGETVARLKGHGKGTIFLASAVYSLAFAPNGKYLASGGHDGRVIVWDVESGKVVIEAQVTSQPIVWSVAFSPDSKLVAGGFEAAGAKHGLCVWKLPSGEPRKEQPFNICTCHDVDVNWGSPCTSYACYPPPPT